MKKKKTIESDQYDISSKNNLTTRKVISTYIEMSNRQIIVIPSNNYSFSND